MDQALSVYYEHCYPLQLLWKWMSNMEGSEDLVLHEDYREVLQIADESQTTREIAFSFDNGGYKRPNFYTSFRHFRQDILNLKPTSLHLGATYNSTKIPLISDEVKLKELVFDIDMSDYRGIIDRTKCECKSNESKTVCKMCWLVMKAGMRVLWNVLTINFGFKHVYFFYSGRRGFHCWVTDHSAKRVSSLVRKNIVDLYFYRPCLPHDYSQFRVSKMERIVSRYSHSKRRVVAESLHQWKIHPSFERDYLALLSTFKEVCYKFELCKGEEGYTKMIELFILDQSDRFAMRYNAKRNTKETKNGCFFHVLMSTVKDYMAPFLAPCPVLSGPMASTDWRQRPHSFRDAVVGGRPRLKPKFGIITLLPRIVFYYLSPRFDREVTTGITHLAKSPFSVHKDTRKICVPVSHTTPAFDPSLVPTVDQLLEDYSNIDVSSSDVVTEKIWKQTRLCSFIQQFASNIHANTQVDMHTV